MAAKAIISTSCLEFTWAIQGLRGPLFPLLHLTQLWISQYIFIFLQYTAGLKWNDSLSLAKYKNKYRVFHHFLVLSHAHPCNKKYKSLQMKYTVLRTRSKPFCRHQKIKRWGTMTNHTSHIEGWAQDWRKSDGCFSPNLISSPWRRNEDYNVSFCKQWKFRCHCSYEQWHLNLHCLQRDRNFP